jgi:5-methyltetrahydropteroyltriglutamate--homocysteine methyltransferase
MKRSTDRILTTHVGSLIRPPEVIAILDKHQNGQPFDGTDAATIRKSIADVMKEQKDVGIDIPNDGEFSKPGFANYILDRLTGFDTVEGATNSFLLGRDRKKFMDAYNGMEGGGIGANWTPALTQLACVGPIEFVGKAFVQQDIDNMKAAAHDGAGMVLTMNRNGCSRWPGIRTNAHDPAQST